MRRVLSLAGILMLVVVNSAFCSNLQTQVGLLQYEMNKLDKITDKQEAELLKPAIEANINYLAGIINLKVKKSEARLEKIKEKIQNVNRSSEDNAEWAKEFSKKNWKKFYSTQKKIESLNDLLFIIEQWKIKLVE